MQRASTTRAATGRISTAVALVAAAAAWSPASAAGSESEILIQRELLPRSAIRMAPSIPQEGRATVTAEPSPEAQVLRGMHRVQAQGDGMADAVLSTMRASQSGPGGPLLGHVASSEAPAASFITGSALAGSLSNAVGGAARGGSIGSSVTGALRDTGVSDLGGSVTRALGALGPRTEGAR